jgi:hypothetical protein
MINLSIALVQGLTQIGMSVHRVDEFIIIASQVDTFFNLHSIVAVGQMIDYHLVVLTFNLMVEHLVSGVDFLC